MANISIQALGRKLMTAREGRGIREVAKEIGVSPATLSRVERGFLPDLETFAKICEWLKIDPAEVLGVKTAPSSKAIPTASVHFRKDKTIVEATAKSLANMILAAQRALMLMEANKNV